MKKTKPVTSTGRKVAIESRYTFSIGDTKNILRSSLESAGILEADKVIEKNESAIIDLTKEIVETKHEVKSIRVLLERRTSKFEGLTEYDEHFIKTFARQAAISLAEALTKKAVAPAGPMVTVYISADGELYREPKSQYTFRMENSSGRMKLVMALMTSRKYIPTKTLIDLTDLSSIKSVQSAVQAIKRMVHKKLKVSEFIVGWQDSGYRINPNVILKKE